MLIQNSDLLWNDFETNFYIQAENFRLLLSSQEEVHKLKHFSSYLNF